MYGDVFPSEALANVVSEEANVRLVRAKVELGEADAALVYRTDALASERVAMVALPPAIDVRAQYSVAAVRGAAQADEAEAFIAFVTSPKGREILVSHGFDVD